MAKIEINSERCKGCEYCIVACPNKVLGLADKINHYGVHPAVVIDADGCTGCALCAEMCPDVCMEVWK